MRITRLEAQGIGPFEDLNIEFKPKPVGMENKAEIHILTGENGTGKSTILMMLASCADVSNDENLSQRFQSMVTFKYNIYLDEVFDTGEEILEKKYDFDGSSIYNGIHTRETYGDDPPFTSEGFRRIHPHYYQDRCIGFAFFGYSSYRVTKGMGLVNIKEITLNPIKKAVDFEKTIDSDLILDWIANVKTKELIAKGKGKVKSKYENAVLNIENAVSAIIGKKVQFDLEESLKISVKVNEISLNFNTLPDGLKSIISWLSDLLMRLDRIDWVDNSKSILEQNFILFLDEIEVHLHPTWQRKILPVVQDLFPNAQIFISTHSPFVVGSVDGARVYKFKLDENNNSVLDSEYLTEDGNSYDRILEEIFDIKERFGVGVQKQLDEFKEYKTKILKGETVDEEAFMKLANEIAKQSIELNGIISFELRQLKRNTTQKLETA